MCMTSSSRNSVEGGSLWRLRSAANAGWVSVGMDNDTAEFAVETIRRWWREMGRIRYPEAKHLAVTADGGGSNGSRVRLWKLEFQRLAS